MSNAKKIQIALYVLLIPLVVTLVILLMRQEYSNSVQKEPVSETFANSYEKYYQEPDYQSPVPTEAPTDYEVPW